jgi:hypothetical protein
MIIIEFNFKTQGLTLNDLGDQQIQSPDQIDIMYFSRLNGQL